MGEKQACAKKKDPDKKMPCVLRRYRRPVGWGTPVFRRGYRHFDGGSLPLWWGRPSFLTGAPYPVGYWVSF